MNCNCSTCDANETKNMTDFVNCNINKDVVPFNKHCLLHSNAREWFALEDLVLFEKWKRCEIKSFLSKLYKEELIKELCNGEGVNRYDVCDTNNMFELVIEKPCIILEIPYD